ncbi:MAG: uridine kinase [Alphaproteobacteria bacterium]|nr:uridine kinase [Alphaproteobacteria bacterium]
MMKKSRLIAITGGSASGKTRLAEALAQHFAPQGCYVLSEDNYYHDAGRFENFDAGRFNFDEPAAKDHDLLEAHLMALRSGEAVEAPIYDFATHCREDRTRACAAAPFVIVEGMHLLTTERLRLLFDLTVYVSAGDDIRLQRRISRDVAERERTEAFARAQFETHVRPMHDLHVEPQKPFADIVLVNRGEPDFDLLMQPVLERVDAPASVR